MSTQGIVERHCRDRIMDSHNDWRSFYDDMVGTLFKDNWKVFTYFLHTCTLFQHLADFDTLTRVQFRDGSYALGIMNPSRTQYTKMSSLITDLWTLPSIYRTKGKTDFSSGPYYGILVIDRRGHPVLAAFRENTNFISLHYYIYGDWAPLDNRYWKNIGVSSVSKYSKAPPFKLRRCNGTI